VPIKQNSLIFLVSLTLLNVMARSIPGDYRSVTEISRISSRISLCREKHGATDASRKGIVARFKAKARSHQ